MLPRNEDKLPSIGNLSFGIDLSEFMRKAEQAEARMRQLASSQHVARLTVVAPDTSAVQQAERALTTAQQAASRERIATAQTESRERVAAATNSTRQMIAAERAAAQQTTAAMRTGSQERIAEASRESRERIAAANNAARAERDAARGNTSGGTSLGTIIKGSAIGNVVSNVATNAVSAVWENGTKAIIGYNDQLDRGRVALEGLLGSQQQAATYQKELLALANATPFSYEQVEKGAIRFLNLGLSAEQSKALVIDAGNAVARFGGTSAQVDRVTLAIAQVGAKGKVSAEELNQLGESGVPGLKILSDYLHISTGETLKLAETGKISANDLFQAFHAYGQLPDVAGAMEKQSHTFTGAISTITDALKLAGATAFRPLFEGIVEAANKIAAFVSTPWFASFVDHIAAAVKSGMALLGQFLAFLAPVGKAILAAFGVDTADLSKQIDDAMKAAKVPTSDPKLFGDNRAAAQAAADAAQLYADNIKIADANILTFRQHLDEVNLALQANKDAQQAVHDFYDPQIRTNARAIQDAQRLTPTESARNTRLAEIGVAKMRIEVEKPSTSVYEGIVREADAILRQLSDKKYTIDVGFANEGRALEAESHRLSKLNADAEEGRVNEIQTRIRALSDAAETANRAMDLEARPIRQRMDDAARATAEQTRLLDVQSKAVSAQASAAQKASEGVVRGLDAEAKTVQNAMRGVSEAARMETTAIERWVTGQRDAIRSIGDGADAEIAVLSKQADALKRQMDGIGRDRSLDRRIEDLQRTLSAPEIDTTGYTNQLQSLNAQRVGPGADQAGIDAAYAATSRQMSAAVRADQAKRLTAKSELEQLQERQIIQRRMDEDHRADLQGQLTVIEEQSKAIRETADTRKDAIEAGIRQAEAEKQSIADTLTLQKDALQSQLDGIERRKGAVQEEARATAEGFAGRLAAIASEKDGIAENARIARDADEGRLRDIDRRRTLLADTVYDQGKALDAELKGAQAALDARTKDIAAQREANTEASYQLGLRKAASDEYFATESRTVEMRKRGAQDQIAAINDEAKRQSDILDKEAAILNLAKMIDDEHRRTTLAPLQAEQERLTRAMEDALLPLQQRQAELEKEARYWQNLITEAERYKQAIEQAKKAADVAAAGYQGPKGLDPYQQETMGQRGPDAKKAATDALKVENVWTQAFGNIQNAIEKATPVVSAFWEALQGKEPSRYYTGVEKIANDAGTALRNARTAIMDFWRGLTDDAPADPGKNITAAETAGRNLHAFWVKDFIPTMQNIWGYLDTNMLPKLGDLATYISGTLLPAWTSWQMFLAGLGLEALRGIATFIFSDLLPQLRDLWGYLDKNIIPTVREVGRVFDEIASSAVGRFVLSLVPLNAALLPLGAALLAPFKSFGDAIEGIMLAAVNSFLGPIQTGLDGIGMFVNSVKRALNEVGGLFGNPSLGGAPWPVPNITVGKRTAAPGGGGGARNEAEGTRNFPGGAAFIGEAGRELYTVGDRTYLASGPMMLNLPAGSVVYNNAETERILSNPPPGSTSAQFAAGIAATGSLGNYGANIGRGAGPGDAIGAAWDATKSAVGGFFSGVGTGAQSIVSKATDMLGTTLSGLKMPELPGVLSKIGPAIAEKIKSTATEGVRGLLSPFAGGNSAGGAAGGGMDALRPLISQYADKHRIPRDLAAALVDRESGSGAYRQSAYDLDPNGNPYAFGLTQIDRRYHSAFLGSAAPGGGTMQDYIQTAAGDGAALDYGFNLLRNKYDEFGGNWDTALLRYNGGAAYPGIIRGLQPKYAGWMADAKPNTGGTAPDGDAIMQSAFRTSGIYLWCEKFIGDAMAGAGKRYAREPDAFTHSRKQPLSPGLGPKGAVTFFPYTDPELGNVGHVAFSGGDGRVYGTVAPEQTGWRNASYFNAPLGYTVNPAANGAYVSDGPALILSNENPGNREGEITSPVPQMRAVVRDALRERGGGEGGGETNIYVNVTAAPGQSRAQSREIGGDIADAISARLRAAGRPNG